MHHLLLLHKQVHDKRGIAESQHAYIYRARLIFGIQNQIVKRFSELQSSK